MVVKYKERQKEQIQGPPGVDVISLRGLAPGDSTRLVQRFNQSTRTEDLYSNHRNSFPNFSITISFLPQFGFTSCAAKGYPDYDDSLSWVGVESMVDNCFHSAFSSHPTRVRLSLCRGSECKHFSSPAYLVKRPVAICASFSSSSSVKSSPSYHTMLRPG